MSNFRSGRRGFMSSPSRSLVFFALFAVSLLLPAQEQCSAAPAATFELTARSGSPVPVTSGFDYTRKNDTDVLVRLSDINPFANKCSVSVAASAYKETAIA